MISNLFRRSTRSVAGQVRYCVSQAYKRKQAEKAEAGRRKLIYVGIPLIGFVVGGSYFLSIFLDTHMELKDQQNKSMTVRKFDLEEEHKTLMKKLDIDNFSLSRIPRPTEEGGSDPKGAEVSGKK